MGVLIQCCMVLDAISMISLLASLPFIVFLAVFVIGHRGLFEDWKLSASLLAGALLAATELSCLLRNLAYPGSSNTHVPSAMVVASTLGSYRCGAALPTRGGFFPGQQVENRAEDRGEHAAHFI